MNSQTGADSRYLDVSDVFTGGQRTGKDRRTEKGITASSVPAFIAGVAAGSRVAVSRCDGSATR